jgi:hypothetical protein
MMGLLRKAMAEILWNGFGNLKHPQVITVEDRSQTLSALLRLRLSFCMDLFYFAIVY